MIVRGLGGSPAQKMALEGCNVLLVIVRVEGPTPAGFVDAVPTWGRITPWTIACRIPATR